MPSSSSITQDSPIIVSTLQEPVSPNESAEFAITFYADTDNGANTDECDQHFVLEYQDENGSWQPMPNTTNGNPNNHATVWWRIKDSSDIPFYKAALDSQQNGPDGEQSHVTLFVDAAHKVPVSATFTNLSSVYWGKEVGFYVQNDEGFSHFQV